MDRDATRKQMYRDVTRATLLGLGLNCAMGAIKLIGGIAGHSFALVSDALNSIGDTLTSMVVLIALRFAQRPPDDEHPYGHTRAEAIAASNVALLVVLSALYIGWEAVWKIWEVRPVPPVWTLWIAVGSIIIKESLYQYNMHVARRTGSSVLVASAWDHRSDALCSLAVLVGLVAIRWGGPSFLWADSVASLIVVAAILWTGSSLLWQSANELMDIQADAPFVDAVRKTAGEVLGVLGVEKLFIRKSGLEYFVDIHIEVDPETTVAEGHEVGHQVKDYLCEKFATIHNVLVHLEPHRNDFKKIEAR